MKMIIADKDERKIKMFKKLILTMTMAILLSGCAALEELKAKDEQNKLDAQKVPVCKTDQECRLAMSKAYAWVSQNCSMKVQIVNDYAIETFNATKSYQVGCSVVKSANADGSYSLVLSSPCPYGGCLPEYWRQANFNREVSAVLSK